MSKVIKNNRNMHKRKICLDLDERTYEKIIQVCENSDVLTGNVSAFVRAAISEKIQKLIAGKISDYI